MRGAGVLAEGLLGRKFGWTVAISLVVLRLTGLGRLQKRPSRSLPPRNLRDCVEGGFEIALFAVELACSKPKVSAAFARSERQSHA